jgi:hypothetical protein
MHGVTDGHVTGLRRELGPAAPPGCAQAQKAVKIAYALRFANLADFVSDGTVPNVAH